MDTYAEVLLVEDNSDHVELILRALRKQSPFTRVLVAKDGADALEYVFCTGQYAKRSIVHQPKIIILDLNLPRVNGFEVLSRLKSDERTRHVPVVVLTSSQHERDMIESYRLGANSYISKPVGFDKFNNAIGNIGSYWVHFNEVPQ